jgi:PAS domain S-box-containing protein
MPPENQNTAHPAPKPPPPAPAEMAALLESGRLSQQIVDDVQEGIVILDRDLRYRLWNPFMEKITGQPAGEVLGKRALDIHGFLKEQGLDALLERALAGHAGLSDDFPHAQKRTNWAGYLSASMAPLRDAKGNVVGVLGTIRDTTRRKRREEAIVANEHRYRQLFDDNPQPMWVHDVETLAFLAVNEAALCHYGYTREEFLFMTLNDILAPASLPAAPREGADLRGSVDEARLWQHRTKSGKVLDVEINSNVVTFAGRRAVLVLANDMTERRKAQQSLQENELKYRTLIEAADVAIFLADVETGRILETNRRAEILLGLPRHKIVGLRLSELSPPEMAVAKRATPLRSDLPLSRASAQPHVWHRAGRRIPVDIISSVIEVGGRKMVQSIYRDLTERKRVEEALANRTRQLEVLARANRQFNAVLEVPVILRTLVSAALDLIQATGGMAGLPAEGKIAFTEYQGRGKTLPIDYRFEPGQGVAGYVLASKLTYFSNDPLKDPLVIPELQQVFNLHNLVNVPILSRDGNLLGCLEIHNTENQRTIEAADLTMLEVLAAGAAVAIENARLLEARQRAEGRYRRLAESVTDLIWSVDLDLRFTDLTPSSVLLLGYTPQELIGRSVFEVLSPESAAMVKQAVGRGLKREHLARKEGSWSRLVEVEQVRKDGSRVWVEARVRLLTDESGNPAGFIGMTRDISERRRTQAELQRSLALHAAALESIPDAILVVDLQGRMVGFNQRFVHLWRIPKAVMESGQDAAALDFVLHQLKDPQAFLAKVKVLYATPEAESHDHLEFKDGRVFERFSGPQRVGGEVVGRVWSFREASA